MFKLTRVIVAILAMMLISSTAVFAHHGSADPRLFIDGSNCGLDNIATYEETFDEDGEPIFQYVEVGGGGWQHSEVYTGPGLPTMSYIVPPQEPEKMWIFGGSQWEGQCGPSQFDYQQDAAAYAHGNFNDQPGRLDEGHSGLVMDTSTCQLFDVTLEIGTTPSSERAELTDLLLAEQRAHQDVVPCALLSSADVQVFVFDV